MEWFDAQPKVVSWANVAKVAGAERSVPCPCCKADLQETQDLYPVDAQTTRSECKMLWRMLQGLRVHCLHHTDMYGDGKCDWTGEYSGYQEHYANCKFKPPPPQLCVDLPVQGTTSSTGVPAPVSSTPSAPPPGPLEPDFPSPSGVKKPQAPQVTEKQLREQEELQAKKEKEEKEERTRLLEMKRKQEEAAKRDREEQEKRVREEQEKLRQEAREREEKLKREAEAVAKKEAAAKAKQQQQHTPARPTETVWGTAIRQPNNGNNNTASNGNSNNGTTPATNNTNGKIGRASV